MSSAIIRSVSRILIPASKSFSSTAFVTHLPELRRIVDPVRRLPLWTPPFNSATFHSLTDARYPKRSPSDKPRRKRASFRPPGPYAWVNCKEGEPILPNQPNEGSVKRRNEKKRIKQRRAFIVSEKRKRIAQMQEAKRKKLMKRVERKIAAVAREKAWQERLVELKRIEEKKAAAAML